MITLKIAHRDILVTGDWHVGHPAHDYRCLWRMMQEMRRTPWVLLGDMLDAIVPGDKRYECGLAEPYAVARRKVVAILRACHRTCIGVLAGNHERKMERIYGPETETICAEAGVPYLGDTAIIVTPSGRRIALTHGVVYMRPKIDVTASKIAMRDKVLRVYHYLYPADLIAVAHGHTPMITPIRQRRTIDGRGGQRLITEPPGVIMVPACVRSHIGVTTYHERQGYPPEPPGWMVIRTRNRAVTIEQYSRHGAVIDCVTWEF